MTVTLLVRERKLLVGLLRTEAVNCRDYAMRCASNTKEWNGKEARIARLRAKASAAEALAKKLEDAC